MTATVHSLAERRAADVGTVRELYRSGACRAERCRASIRWVDTVKRHPRTGHRLLSGAPLPLDQGADPVGLMVLDRTTEGAWLARPGDGTDPADCDPRRPHYALHWCTCIEPGLYGRVKAAADPLGLLPSAAPRQQSASTTPVCPGCCLPNRDVEVTHHRLCLTCGRAAVAGWSSHMVPTIRHWTPERRELYLVTEDSPAFRRILGLDRVRT